jgi:hypothetical protein
VAGVKLRRARAKPAHYWYLKVRRASSQLGSFFVSPLYHELNLHRRPIEVCPSSKDEDVDICFFRIIVNDADTPPKSSWDPFSSCKDQFDVP